MTAQIKEVLLMNGEHMWMDVWPPLPTRHPRLRAVDPLQNVTRGLEQVIRSTACWRGYVATWSVDEDRLFLARVEGRYQLEGSEPLLADWFTGVLKLAELHIKVAAGVVVAIHGTERARHELPVARLLRR